MRSLSRARWCSCFHCAFPLGVGLEPVAQVVFQEQDLLLQVGGEGCGRGHDAPSAAETAGRESIHSASRRKNWPGAASGSGRLSMMAPWLPGSCGTSDPDRLRAAGRQVGPPAEHGQVPVPGQRGELGEQDRAGSLGRAGRGRVDRGFDGGQAALDQRGEPGRVPAALRRGVGGLDHVPGQAHLGRLGPHRVDQHLGHVHDHGSEPVGQRLDGPVGPVGVHAEGQERPGGGALGQPVPGAAAADQLRRGGRGDRWPGGRPGPWCRRRGWASGSRAGPRRRPGRARRR